jgi:selenocysteine lyase/cysteine desulfurase
VPDALAALRSAFPAAGSVVYFNHAAVAPLCRPVVSAMQGFLDEAARQGSLGFRGWLERRERARGRAARLIGAAPEEVAFVTSTSQGLIAVAEGLDWHAGDRVVVLEHDFPANLMPWYRQRRHGVEVVVVPRRDGRVPVEAILSAVDERTRLVAVSWVLYDNGYRLDLPRLGAALAEHNRQAARPVRLCVDAIQGLGAFPLDVHACGIDFLSADSHKWMLGLEGIGLFYCRRELLDELDPPCISWWSLAKPFAPYTPEARLQPDARRHEFASLPNLAVFGFDAALGLLLEVGAERTATAVLDLTRRLAEGLAERGWTLHTPLTADRERSGIVSASHPDKAAAEVVAHLESRHVSVARRGDGVRFSPHAWNTIDEVDQLLRCLP